MNSWTRCFIAALALATVGALCLFLIPPLQRAEIADAEAMRTPDGPNAAEAEAARRRTLSASTN